MAKFYNKYPRSNFKRKTKTLNKKKIENLKSQQTSKQKQINQ